MMNKNIRIFLDDERYPEFVGWNDEDPYLIIVRDYQAFVQIVSKYPNQISEISFDHDLGLGKNGHDCITWLEEQIFVGNVVCPDRMQVHSMNTVGSHRIQQAIDAILSRQLKH